MARGRVEIEAVKLLQVGDPSERIFAEGSFALESMQHDSFQQIAKRHVFVFSEGFQDFKQPLFHTDAGLDALNNEVLFASHRMIVPWYICTTVK